MNIVPSLHGSKSQLRKEMRHRRAGLDPSRRAELDSAINRHLLEFADRCDLRTVAAYLAFDGEPELSPALLDLERRGVRLALPVVHEEPGRSRIRFRQWSHSAPMQRNRYGISEPCGTPEVPVGDIDLVLVPLVAWDACGGRLGMGASFYDRLFQPFADRSRPIRVGVGYRVQQLEQVPLEPWDVPLHRVLTDDGVINCSPDPEPVAAGSHHPQTASNPDK